MPSPESRRPVVLLLSVVAALLAADILLRIAVPDRAISVMPEVHADGVHAWDSKEPNSHPSCVFTSNAAGNTLYVWHPDGSGRYMGHRYIVP